MAGTNLCMIHLEMVPKDAQRRTYRDGELSDDLDNIVFPWGSLTKMVVIVALSVIIDELAVSNLSENERFKSLRGAWDRPFVECFNKVSKARMSNLLYNVKVGELATHYRGIPPINHIIMAPDGTPLMSNDDFLAVASHLAADAYGQSEAHSSRWNYSNGNAILIGMFIEAAYGKPLPKVVEELVFRRFGMRSAYMGTKHDPDAALPHEASGGETVPIESPQTLSDPLCIAAMGVRSNANDIATFFRSIVTTFPDEPGGDLRPTIMSCLLGRRVNMEGGRYYPCGVFTTLDTTIPGLQSLNRLTSPESSSYVLGSKQPGNKPVEVCYSTGRINGFEACTYIIPSFRTFLIVQANTSGRVDACDHISRLILQSSFDLRPSSGPRVDIPAMVKQGVEEGVELLAEFTQSQSVHDDDSAIPSNHLVGTYTHDRYRQTFLVTEREGKLWVRWQGSRIAEGHPVQSGEMQLLRVTAHLVRMKVRFNVDRLDAWRDLDFRVSRDGNRQVVSLCRENPYIENNSITYVRSPD
ncbi:hypothetical protein GP486_006844 [Trichoglossum hirsutum]|uniref:Beta-lactamase-related domain-containing protein n=1 Tax=Trichoglossum hirsutum TaxID=265104 RepID=A0A9P8L3B5_9PEZI|nr:hypothetical protein GP486_006844 [Trichoglossum hirsutum]